MGHRSGEGRASRQYAVVRWSRPGSGRTFLSITLSSVWEVLCIKRNAGYEIRRLNSIGGDAQIRTGGEGFAGLCLTTWPRRQLRLHSRKKAGQTSSMTGLLTCNGADDGVRTRDPDLGKVVLYQLSHVRVARRYNTRTSAITQPLIFGIWKNHSKCVRNVKNRSYIPSTTRAANSCKPTY